MRRPSCIAIRHLPFEGLDAWEETFRERFDFQYLDIASTELPEDVDPDVLVVLGGPVGVGDTAEYPFLQDEIALLKSRLQRQRPTLGICLGAQLMAHALGADVQPGATREIGWQPLQLTPAGEASCLRHLAAELTSVFHWHSDNFSLPPDAERLAATPACPNQAFRIGSQVLGLQFHPEVSARALETWYVGHHRALAANDDLSARQLRSEARRHDSTLQAQGRKLLEEWLDGLTPAP